MGEKNLENTKIPGFFLKEDVNHVIKLKGPEGLKLLKEKMKDVIDISSISSFKNYSLSIEIKLIEKGCDVAYGDHSPEAYRKWGFHDFQTMANSTLGKVGFSLYKDPGTMLKQGKNLFDFYNSLIEFDYKIVSDKEVVAIIKNNPYHPSYYGGLFEGFLDRFKCPNYKITIKTEGNATHYIGTWD